MYFQQHDEFFASLIVAIFGLGFFVLVYFAASDIGYRTGVKKATQECVESRCAERYSESVEAYKTCVGGGK